MRKNILWSPKFRVIGTFFHGLAVSDVWLGKDCVMYTLLPDSYSN